MDPNQPLDKNTYFRFERHMYCKFPGCDFRSYHTRLFEDHLCRHTCDRCGCYVLRVDDHLCQVPEQQIGGGPRPLFQPSKLNMGLFSIKKTVHNGTLTVFEHKYNDHIITIGDSFRSSYDDLTSLLRQYLDYFKSIQFQIVLSCELFQLNEQKIKTRYLRSPYIRTLHPNFIPDGVNYSEKFITSFLEAFSEGDSGHVLQKVDYLQVNILQYQPIKPKGFIELPSGISRRAGVLSIDTRPILDNESFGCFICSVLHSLYRNEIRLPNEPEKSYDELSRTKKKTLKRYMENGTTYIPIVNKIKELGLMELDGFLGDVGIEDIPVFEQKNSIAISVYKCEGKHIYPIYIGQNHEKQVHLLLLERFDTSSQAKKLIESHYASIYDLGRFLRRGGPTTQRICRWCLKSHPYSFEEHERICKFMHDMNIKFVGSATPNYKFKNLSARLPLPYYIFYDIQTREIPLMEKSNGTNLYYTNIEGNLEASGYYLALVSQDGIIYDVNYEGEMPMEHFITTILFIATECIRQIRQPNRPYEPSKSDWRAFHMSQICVYCDLPYDNLKRKKVLHHYREQPNYCETICSICNLSIVKKRVLVAVSFNGAKHHHPFIIKSLSSKFINNIEIIPKSQDNILAIFIDKILKCVDFKYFQDETFSDLVMSLSNSKNATGYSQFKLTKQRCRDSQELGLIIDCIPQISHVSATNDESCIEKSWFVNNVTNEPLSDKCFADSKVIFTKFGCRNAKDFKNICLKFHALLLADVYIHFANYTMRFFGLSVSHYVSYASYIYDCAMFQSRAEWQYITCPEMVKLISSGIRGGSSFLCSNQENAKNVLVGGYESGDQTYIMDTDITGCYAFSLSKPLPYRNYRFLSQSEIDKFDIYAINERSTISYILQVDLVYTNKAQLRTIDLPLCPEKIILKQEDLSSYQKHILSSNNQYLVESYRLICSHSDKKKYVVIAPLLLFYIKMGMVISKIHAILEFEIRDYLHEFVRRNMNLRKNCDNSLQKRLLKGACNMLAGKLSPNTSNIQNIHISLSRNDMVHQTSLNTFKDITIISPNLALIFHHKSKVIYKYPTIQYLWVLENAKLHIYTIYYDYLKRVFGEKIRLIGHNTDSFLLHITETGGELADNLNKLNCVLDRSGLGSKHKYFSEINKGEMGMLRVLDMHIKHFYGLRAKSYCFVNACICSEQRDICERCSTKLASTIPTYASKTLQIRDYVSVLKTLISVNATYTQLVCKDLSLSRYTCKRTALSLLDLSRYFYKFNHSLPFYHFRNKLIEESESN